MEPPLQRGDPWAFITAGSAVEAAAYGLDMGSAIKGLLGQGNAIPLVVSVGCPAGEAGHPDCSQEFAVAVSSLAEGEVPATPTAGLAVIGFERTATGIRTVGLSGAPEREVVKRGGTWRQNVRFAIAGCAGCSLVFVPYHTNAALEPELTLGREAKPIAAIREISFPTNFSIIVAAHGGPKGHGGAFRLVRFSRLTGAIEERTLWAEDGALITGVALGEEDRNLLLSVCRGPSCYLEGGPKNDVVTSLYRSGDGGVTWVAVGERRGEWSVIGGVEEQMLLGRVDTGNEWLLHPSGEPVRHRRRPGFIPERPVAFGARPAWLLRTEPAVVLAVPAREPNGYEELLRAPVPSGLPSRIEAVPPSSEQNVVLLSTLVEPPGAPFPFTVNSYIAAFTRSGDFTAIVRLGQTTFRPRFASGFIVTGELDDATPAVCPSIPSLPYATLPALLDLESGGIPVIREFACTVPYSFLVAAAAVHVRVSTPGDCLNLRTEPDGAIVRRIADGVILGREGEPDASTDGRWLHVTTPAGQSGWVAAEFVVQ